MTGRPLGALHLKLGDRVVYGPDPRTRGFALTAETIGTVKEISDHYGVTYAKVVYAAGKPLTFPAIQFTLITD